ncbi:hypothetical protein J5N97_019553 [Dioscorea zingiberensis]|uniref:Glycosyltransferase 61 catalytic domain-containing protein n=1 Tax=Dioscorea zingiberensis TaxID=325984 RepID=A0A9D5CEX7_9LILI|nr:hypothetical protein J5N97_019553 [Dioscorea zingiberensis]
MEKLPPLMYQVADVLKDMRPGMLNPIYARKRDKEALKNVREVSLRCLNGYEVAPQCTINQSIPALVFSTGGYAGNLFHDYSDILIPLFLTAYHYHGEVQLLVTNAQTWWLRRHRRELSQITRYQIIDFDNDSEVRCYSDVIVGLHSHKEFNIDPLRAPIGHSMANFTQFMRRSYSLKRDTLNQIGGVLKPRVLIIARKRTRSFTNINQIVQMAAETGCEVVVKEPGFGTGMAEVANIVNSCEMMIGVHGAGLSNLVFLPENAVLIQIVPYGKLEGIGWYSFGLAAGKAKLKYIQYEISSLESSLMEEYPKDHPVIANPDSIHKQGWNAVKNVYLIQNITLDVKKFRPVLIEALKLLQNQDDM